MKRLIPALLLIVPFSVFSQLQFTMVDPGTQTLTITNFGTETDIADYRLCSLFDYTTGFADATVSGVVGDFVLSNMESVTLTWNAASGGFDPVAADMGLYLPSGSFSNAANMVCFMEYGAGMLGREPQAVSAGLWETNTFVTGDAPYIYVGDGTQSGAEYWTGFVLPPTNLVINEVDSDTPAADIAEFVELLGAPNEALDGLVVVFYNGSNDFSYEAFDLDGYTCDELGFFVLGNAGVPNVDFVFNNNVLQNGPDAVAVYYGDDTDFPDNTVITNVNLVDAVVYDTSDPDDMDLLFLIDSGGQINEDTNGNGVNQSVSRVPDGGEQLNTGTYVAQLPTPGETNILTLCDGGFVLTNDGSSQVTACLDSDPDIVEFAHMTSEPGSVYEYVITDNSDNIEIYPVGDSYDFNSLLPGTYRVYGISYYGEIDASTVETGDPVTGILASGDCTDISATYITVIVQGCTIGEGCIELFFSEYIEGAGNNKALEIVNPSNLPADLSDYFIHLYSNGNTTASNIFGLNGTLDPGEAIVISNVNADEALQDLADELSNVTLFNGNDAIELRHLDESIDIIGVIGTDPGTSWVVASGSTANHGLVRQPDVTAPTTDWILSSSQWDVYDAADYSHLGSHDFVSCDSSVPVISFSDVSWPVDESDGTVEVTINVYNPLFEVEINVNVIGGTATEDVDFSDNLPQTVIFPQGSTTPQTISINIIDDVEEETAIESIVLELSGDEDFVDFINQQASVFILPNDYVFPFYDIATVASTNGSGIADSLGVDCEVKGVVHGINFNSAGLWFTLIDSTDGILIYNTLEDFGYAVSEGDSASVQGLIFQFMGQQQLIAHNVSFISSGNPVETPLTVTELTEENESHMVHIECVEVVDPAEWTNDSEGFLVTVSDGDEDYGLFIDGDTDIYGEDAPDGHFSITGIGHQFDTTEPFTGGYQVYPRGLFDFTDFVIASFEDPGDLEFGDIDDETIDFVNTSDGGETWTWDFGDGETSSDEDPSHTYDHSFLSANSTITITLTIESGTCSDSFTITINTTYVGVGEWDQAAFRLYPVPADEILHLDSSDQFETITISDALGRQVLKQENVMSNHLVINVADFLPGLYILEVRNGDSISLRKFEVR